MVEEHSASSSAALNFTTCLSSTYDTYQIEIVDLITGTSGVDINWQASTNGGSTYDTGSTYIWEDLAIVAGGTGSGGENTGTRYKVFGGASIVSNRNQNATIKFKNPADGLTWPTLFSTATGWDTVGDPRPITHVTGGAYGSTTTVDAFRIIASSGNLASGTVRCYGLSK